MPDTVGLDGDDGFGIGAIEAPDEPPPVVELDLADRFREARPPQYLHQPDLEGAGGDSVDLSSTVEQTPEVGRAVATPAAEATEHRLGAGRAGRPLTQRRVERALEGVGIDDRREVEKGAGRLGDRYAIDTCDEAGQEVRRVVEPYSGRATAGGVGDGDVEHQVGHLVEVPQPRRGQV